jgi:hypothetical protein
MCREYDKNREKLSDLIFELQEFTEEQLKQAFNQRCQGNAKIGRLQTVRGYLGDLCEFGALRFEAGRYYVQQRSPVLA